MKKTFILNHPKKTKDRQFEGAIHEVKKYFKRESKKQIPEEFDIWEFDCKFGNTKEDAKVVTRNDITPAINKAKQDKLDSFYVEILAKPGKKSK